MITKSTIDKIIETARIEEVVGDYVALKKRGANLLGNCPFHNEKTPSFTVSPARGIYKCFGCGKAGNAVGFLMEHDHLTYPEALKHLAKKYGIEVEEDNYSPEQIIEQNERESLYVVISYAQKYFCDKLFESEEGKAIGLTYFKERGFSEDTIQKFQLGFSLKDWDGFTQNAIENGFTKEVLVKAGLTIEKDKGDEETSARLYDRFRNRVIFPVHNVSGRVIAFGARILQTDPKSPKYLNSPESEIYIKSKSLYGIYFAKKSIIQNDECFLVEGYTDVISLHQTGIENVVASSGTSLTQDQIRLIGRYTKNVTILYDGDTAGIKASLRGIDLILEEGLNVKIVLFPDGEDPDSYSKKVSAGAMLQYIKDNAKDFINFKTALLLQEAANDPVKKAALIKDIVGSIAKIPDAILRSAYIKQCAVMMEMNEQVLVSEMNKLRKDLFRKQFNQQEENNVVSDELFDSVMSANQPAVSDDSTTYQEKEIVRVLLNYGDREFYFQPDEGEPLKLAVRDFMLNEILTDGVGFDDEVLAGVFTYFSNASGKEFQEILDELKSHNEENIRNKSIELLFNKYDLHNWESKHIYVKSEELNFNEAVVSPVFYLKLRRVLKMKKENQEQIKNLNDVDTTLDELMEKQKLFDALVHQITKRLGIVVLK